MSLLAAALAALLAAPAHAAPAEPYPSVRSDERVELLAAVRLLAGDAGVSAAFFRRDTPYVKELSARLAPFARHPAIERWQELERAGVGYVAAYQWLLTLGPAPELAASAPASEATWRPAGGAVGLEEFRVLLSDFARASDFSRTYAATAALREPLVDDARRQAAALGIRRDAERYAGVRAPDYELIVSPFVEPAVSITAATRGPDGRVKLTSITGPEEFDGRVLVRVGTRRTGLWAEALRVMLRPAHEARLADLKASRALFAPIAGRCASDWEECALRETSLAAAGRLIGLAGERAASIEVPIKYARVGMPHLGALMTELEAFEKAPGRGLAFEYPRLVSVFTALASSEPAGSIFSGGIAEALADPAPCVLILPEKPGPALRSAVDAFARARRICDEVLTPEAAAARRLTGVGIVAAGGLEENAWLRARWKDLLLPLTFAPGGLAFGPRPGEKLGSVVPGRVSLASVARSPDDPARPVLVFTAAEPDGAALALASFSGRFDFEVFEGTTAVKSGLYEKSRVPWRPK